MQRTFKKSHIAMQREFSDIAQNQKGLLRVGIAAARGRVILPEAIIRLHQRST
jgi:DNA-binding transcriptional LysR family regulator